MYLHVISSLLSTYWPTDLQKVPNVIDFGVVQVIPCGIVIVETSVELSSNHSPIVMYIRNQLIR